MDDRASLQEFSPPEGFRLHGHAGGFVGRNGPVYVRFIPGGTTLTTQLRPEHCNAGGFASGGFLVTLIDIAMGVAASASVATEGICPTIQLNCNFAAPAQVGDIVIGEVDITRVTSAVIFATGRLVANGKTIVTASGVFRVAGKRPDVSAGRGATSNAAPNQEGTAR